MLIVSNIMAYQPMVVEGYSWNVVSAYWSIFPDITTYNTRKQQIEGDSIINGITYKKLWEHLDANSDKYYLLALIREDIDEQKIFAYNKVTLSSPFPSLPRRERVAERMHRAQTSKFSSPNSNKL